MRGQKNIKLLSVTLLFANTSGTEAVFGRNVHVNTIKSSHTLKYNMKIQLL